MGCVNFSPEARRDVTEIAEWIARDSCAAALRVVDEIDTVLSLILRFPEAAESADQLIAGMRRITAGSYVIYYRHRGDDIEVVRVVHGARDIGKLFR